MQLSIQYDFRVPQYKSLYYITFQIKDENGELKYPFIYDNKETIKVESLLSEDYLKANNVEYYIDNNTKEIIPIGIIDFSKSEYSRFLMYAEGSEMSYNAYRAIQNVKKAIKEKYKAYGIIKKCNVRSEDIITLETD